MLYDASWAEINQNNEILAAKGREPISWICGKLTMVNFPIRLVS